MWVLSAIGVSEVAYEKWQLPAMMVILGFGVLLATRFCKPWMTSLIICASALALGLKLDSDFELSALPIVIWILTMTLVTAGAYALRRRAKPCEACDTSSAVS